MTDPKQLLGVWVSHPEDVESAQVHGWSRLEFRADGTAVSTTHPAGIEKTNVDRYWVDKDDLLFHDTAGKAKRVSFCFGEDSRLLILGMGEGESRYVREPV